MYITNINLTMFACKFSLGNLHLGIISDNKIEGINSYVFEWTSKSLNI